MHNEWLKTNLPDFERRNRRLYVIRIAAFVALVIAAGWTVSRPSHLPCRGTVSAAKSASVDTSSGVPRLVPWGDDFTKCKVQTHVRIIQGRWFRFFPHADYYRQETGLQLTCASTKFRGPCTHYTEAQLHDELVRYNRAQFESLTETYPYFDFNLTPGVRYRILWGGVWRNLVHALVILGFAAVLAWGFLARHRLVRQLRRLDQGRCPRCAYKLLPDQFTCSECGRTL